MKYHQTYRLHPTPEQAAVIRQRFALAGFAYNWALQETERVWAAEHRHLSLYDMIDIYRHHVNYNLHRTFSREEHEALVHLDHAYTMHFTRKYGHPRMKQPEDMNSCTVRAEILEIDYERQLVRLPHAGRVRCRLYRHLQDTPTTATIKEVKPGLFNLVFLSEHRDVLPKEPAAEVVGIDLGLGRFATLSDGTIIDYPSNIWDRHACRREQHLQRTIKRRHEGSRRYEKARSRLSRICQHKANQQRDFHLRTAIELCRDYKAIAVESLAIEDMKQEKAPYRRSLNRHINQYGLSAFIHRLECRCLRTGTQLLRIGRFEPTSKTCHVCGYRLPELDLSIRQWTCPECHTQHDRDINAAINIKLLGQQQQQTLPSSERNVTTEEQSQRPCAEPVKMERPKTAPASAPKEAKKQGSSRLALTKRTLNASDFLKHITPIIKPEKVREATGLTQVQLSSARRSLAIEWRRQYMAEKCEALRLAIIAGLQDALPPLGTTKPEKLLVQMKKLLSQWLRIDNICAIVPGMTDINKHNCLQWHLYISKIIKDLQLITIQP